MPVAKSYQNFEIVGEVFVANGRKYVNVKNPVTGNVQRVRWYNDAEYARMYGTPAPKYTIRSQKEVMGFTKGFITIFKGNTYPHKEWFKENGARFNRLFKWYFISEAEVPEEIPEGLEAIEIPWEAVSDPETDKLLPDETVETYVNSLIAEPVDSDSEFVGEIGERIEKDLTVTRAIALDGFYGPSTMHIMEDEDGNVYVWTTKAKSFPEGKMVTLRGTIKEHKEYKGVKQTVLTRCKEIEG